MDERKRWRLLDPAALSCRVLRTAVMAMVVVAEEEEVLLLRELLEVTAVEVEAVVLEEGVETLEEVTGLATTVVKEVMLPEIALTSPQVIQDKVVAELVRATATTVESLAILRGIVPQPQVPRVDGNLLFQSRKGTQAPSDRPRWWCCSS
jgi:hypothetical protein